MADNKLILEIGARLESTFATAFSSAQQKINALGRELSELKRKQELIKRFDIDTQNVETAKQKLEAARKKVDELRQAAANDPTGGLNKQLAAAEREAEKLGIALGKTEERLTRTKERMGELGVSTENTGQQLETLAKQAEKVEKAIAAKSDAMERNGRIMGKFKLSVLDVADAHSGLAAKLLATKTAVATLSTVVAGAVPVLGQMATNAGMAFGTAFATANVAAVSKELENLARSTDMSKQSLQEWRLAGRFEGIAAELNEFGDMSKVFGDMNQSLKSLGTEDGKAFAASMQSIGLSVEDLKGKKADEALLKIGDALSKSKLTDAQKSSILAGISDDAANLWPLLEKSGQKLNEITQYAHAVGAIQSDAQLEAMKQTNTELSYFKLGLEGVQTQLSAVGSNVVNTLGPNIRQLFIDAKKPIGEWGEAVDKTLKKFKSDLDNGGWGVAFNNMFKAAYPTLHQFVSSAAAFGKGYGQAFISPMLEELKKGYAGISSALAGAGGAESLGRGMGEAMQPVIGIVHNVVGAVKLLISNWDTLKTVASFTPVGFVVSHWDAVVSVFSAVGNGIRKVGEALGLLNPATTASATGVQIFLAALGGLLAASASTKLALGLVGAAVSTFSFALGPLASAIGIAATAFRALAAVAIANPIGAAIAVIATGAALIYANWDKISGWWSGLWGGIKATVSGAWASVKASVADTSIGQGVIKVWSDVSVGVNAAWGDIKRGASAVWTSIGPTVTAGLNAFRQAHVVAFEAVKGLIGPLWSGMANLTKTGLSVISGAAAAGWAVVKQGAELAGNGIKTVVSAWWEGVKLIFSGAWAGIKAIVNTGWEGIKTVFKAATQALQGDFAGAWKTIKTGVSSFIADVLAALRKTVGDFVSIGKDMLAGLARGIADGAAAAVSKAKAAAGEVYSSVKGFFQIHSPSRLMAGLGVEVSAGLAVGIEDAGGKAVQAAASVSVSVSDEFSRMAGDINKTLTDAFMSLDFGNLGKSLVGLFKQNIVQPILSNALKPLSDGIASAFGSIGKSLGSLFSGGSVAGGGLFSNLGGMVSQGLGGLGSALSGGLSGIMGSIGSFVSAIPGWGWALAGVAGLAKLFGGPSDPKARFTQGSLDGQAMLGQGGYGNNPHRYQTAFGQIGFTADSDHIARKEGFVKAAHEMMQQMQALDQMIADTMPHHVAKFTSALKGLETSGFSTGDMLKQRYQTVFSALPEELQKAMANGRDMTKATAEEIIAEFGKLAEVAKSGLVTSLQSLGLNLGSTKDSALAAAMGLTNLMGGIDKVKAANDFFYQEFFSEEERKQAALKQANAAVLEWNRSLGLQGQASIRSHEAFKKHVQGLDLSTEAGRKAYAAAMAVAGSLDAVADASKAAAAQHAEVVALTSKLGLSFGGMGPKAIAASEALVTLMGGMDKFTQATSFYYDNFYSDKEKEQLTLAQAAVDVRNFNKGLGLSGEAAIDTADEFRKYVDGLSLQTKEGREAYAAAMNVARSMDTVADSGKSVNKLMAELPREMIKMFQGVKKPLDDAGTNIDKNSKLAAESMQKLSNKAELVSGQASIASTNLNTMKTAVVALADVLVTKAGEISAATAKTSTPTTTTTTTSKTDGSHALGLRNVPFDGYRAILHKDEAVIPARDAAILRMGMPVMMDAQTNILLLSAANDEKPVSLPAGVTPLPQRVTQVVSQLNRQTPVEVSVPTNAPIHITINATAGQDAAQIAAEVERVLKRVQAQQARQLRAQHRDGVA
ncbi:hypothetical protein [uncultured Thiothrix sp.]|uniref:hypothetical protein n=1 Tax=uncultured Thiothrix sp. TaxID=223185 RepID=UPI00261C02DF|nr:hypothetical protein [uncultured Thiothrix sp.]